MPLPYHEIPLPLRHSESQFSWKTITDVKTDKVVTRLKDLQNGYNPKPNDKGKTFSFVLCS